MTDQTRAWGAGLASSQSDGGCQDRRLANSLTERGSSSPPTTPNIGPARSVAGDTTSRLLHASSGFPIAINAQWRVSFDRLQFILECRRGERWLGRSFCVTRQALLRCIREHCDQVDQAALPKVAALPEWHPDRGEP